MDGCYFITDGHSEEGIMFNAYYTNHYEYDINQLRPGLDYPSNKDLIMMKAFRGLMRNKKT